MKQANKDLAHRLAKLDGLMRRCFGHAGHGGAHNPHRGQGRVLSILKLQPKMSQRELGYLLDMRKQSLGELLAKLEAQGFITRTPSEEDRRAMVIQLTETGKEAAAALDEDGGDDNDLFAALSEEEQKQLGEYLDRLIASLQERVGGMEDERTPHFGPGGNLRFGAGFAGGCGGRHHGEGCGKRDGHGPHGRHGKGGHGPHGFHGQGMHGQNMPGGHGPAGFGAGYAMHGGFPERDEPGFAPGSAPGTGPEVEKDEE